MSIPPPAPGSPAPKKGLSGLAIAGIGCGGLIVIGLIGVFILVGKACTGLKEYAQEAQKNPAKAAALLAAKFNPDIEVISTDDAKGEITLKDKKTGKVTTLSFDDIKNGKFSITDEHGGKVTVDGAQVGTDGSIKIQGPNGETVITASKGLEAPAWVPQYPGLKAGGGGGMRSEKDGITSGVISGETTDPVGKVKEFFESKLKAAGYTVEANIANANGADSGFIKGVKEDGRSSINIMLTGEGEKTSVAVQYQGPK